MRVPVADLLDKGAICAAPEEEVKAATPSEAPVLTESTRSALFNILKM
jgi:hypothetical protein